MSGEGPWFRQAQPTGRAQAQPTGRAQAQPTGRALGEAFAAVPRRDFLPLPLRAFAREDRALQIGYGVTNSQPTTVRNMLALLAVETGHQILDVGSGSAWTTALLAHLTGPTGRVIGVERIPEVLQLGRDNLGERFAWATLHPAIEGVLGWPAEAPYDRILVSADAVTLPESLVDQLAIGGLMVIPVRGVMMRVLRTDEETEVSRHGLYSFVPLYQ